jgi:isopentenyldiphosphate isomerase
MPGDELLDILDAGGAHLGTKPRRDVHRDGDWHRAFHLWVVRADGVLLQRRSRTKASWPGFLDATAAGHLLAGESVPDGLREAEEELGVTYTFDALVDLGVHPVDETRDDGRINRELQHVFAVRDERPLEAYTNLDAAEVAGLVLVGHPALRALVGGAAGARPGTAWDGRRRRPVDVTAAELVPSPYLPRIIAPLADLATASDC